MGIKSNFNQLLKCIDSDIFKTIELSTFAYEKIAIDTSLYIHKFKAIAGPRWLSCFINLVSCLRKNQLHCVFIFDGKAPREKSKEISKRRENREKMENSLFNLQLEMDEYENCGIIGRGLQDFYKSIIESGSYNNKRLLKKTNNSDQVDINLVKKKIQEKENQLYEIKPEDYEIVKQLFNILKIPWYVAEGEAEKLCSWLCKNKKVLAVLSEDTDVLAYGADIFLSKIDSSNGICVCVKFEDLLNRIQLNKTQFLDLCIMCGTDYNTNIPKIGSKTAYKYIKELNSIENIEKQKKIDISCLNHEWVRCMFNFDNYKVDYIPERIPYCSEPDWCELDTFIRVNKIEINFDRIKNNFLTPGNIVFIEDDE